VSITVTTKGEGFKRLNALLKHMPNLAEKVVNSATLNVEKVIKDDFMTVQDGDAQVFQGRRFYPPRDRSKQDVRTSTGNLKRNTRSAFIGKGARRVGKVGTNVWYATKLLNDPDFEFLVSGLNKAWKNIKRVTDRIIKAELKRAKGAF